MIHIFFYHVHVVKLCLISQFCLPLLNMFLSRPLTFDDLPKFILIF